MAILIRQSDRSSLLVGGWGLGVVGGWLLCWDPGAACSLSLVLLVFCVHRGRLESLLMGVLSNKKSVANFPGGD